MCSECATAHLVAFSPTGRRACIANVVARELIAVEQ